MTLEDLRGKKVAVLGLGENNRHLVDFFRRQNIAFEIFHDWENPSELTGRLDSFDILFRTPGLPYLSEPIVKAHDRGALIYSQTKLFFDLCPCEIMGVTGTKGKGTTSTLIAEILKKSKRRVWLAGNIGHDPFDFIDKIESSDLVILELSSFQLQDLHKSPQIAVVLKIIPEHLDYHRSFEEYVKAKQNIVLFQNESEYAILSFDSEVVRGFSAQTRARVAWYSTEASVMPGVFIKDETVYLADSGKVRPVMPIEEVGLLGKFNLENIAAAIAAVSAAGFRDISVMRDVIRDFRGLPHRLEPLGIKKGVVYVNDSASTIPETTIAALSALTDRPIILIIGGSDKGSDYSLLAKTIAQSKVKALIPIGLTGARVANLARNYEFVGRIVDDNLTGMSEIVSTADALAEKGDLVLLSPASASFDMFVNYQQRGDLFKEFFKQIK